MNHKRKVNDMDSPTEPAIENDKNVDMFLRGDGLKYVKQLEAEKAKLQRALRKNIKYCQYVNMKRKMRCKEIAHWGIFDYDGWREYYCDEHKDTATSSNTPELLADNILAEQALQEKGGE